MGKVLKGAFVLVVAFFTGILWNAYSFGQAMRSGNDIPFGDQHYLPVQFEKTDNGLCDLFLTKPDGKKDYLRRIDCPVPRQ